ncbi:MAG TPA: oligopeptidase A [Opitutae bacterium]|nr:oligopeptidase A [Opitutaceae bacterium]HCR31428.1 oligopeptidase A [Opitutae bacterium]
MGNENGFLNSEKLVDWQQLTPDRVESDIEEALGQTKAEIEVICQVDASNADFENTFLALENAGETLLRAWGRVEHLTSVNDSKELREAYNNMLPKVTEFNSGIPLNPRLWQALKNFAGKSEVSSLRGIQKRLFEETVADFEQAGANLNATSKSRLEEINKELAQKTQKYSENVLDATNAYELIIEDEDRLAGLPESARAGAFQSAKSKELGSEENPVWRFTLHAPSIMPVLKFAEDEELRRELYEASSSVGAAEPYDNTELIREILKLRAEKATLLGKDNFADNALQRRMAKSGRAALEFVEDLHRKTKEAFDREVDELEQFVAKETGKERERLEPWSATYWAEKLRQRKYDFDEEAVRPYFPIDRVLAGMFQIAERLFSVEMREREGSSVWHKDVKVYDLLDASGELLGYFYADWHPREEKRGGAWMNFLDTGLPGLGDSKREPHLGLICGNLTAPIGDQAALLTHYEVETVFHEFGHLLHHLLSDVEIKSLSGVNVAWDFVELPSQIMENWCWNRDSLDLFARHHETGDPIPEELFQKMQAARNFNAAIAMMRQLALGKMDLELHLNPEKYYEGNLDELVRQEIEDYSIPLKIKPPTIVRRFSHLFSSPVGYAAGYYSYKWAEVLDADAFTRFAKEGVFNRDTGMAFRECVLSKGNSEDPMELFKRFMGREPEPEALLVRSGLD